MALKTVPFNVAFTFSRPDPADYEDVNGDTQTAGTDVPRFNFSEGVGEGLILEASLSETAAIDDVPLFNASAGHWVINAKFYNSEPLKGMGLNERFQGSGQMVISYSGEMAKVWAGGQAIYTVEGYTPAEPAHICEGGKATIAGMIYKPFAISDVDAATLATGDFEVFVPLDPLSLFANGENGAWYEPRDLATLFQDGVGKTPVAADGDPAGMMLDNSKGLALGVEQTINGEFSSDLSDWATSSHWVWNAGRAEMPSTSSFLPLSQDVGFVSGKFYQITIEVSAVSGVCKLHPGIPTNDYQFSTTGLVTFIALAGSGELEIARQTNPSSCIIESVSVKELPGNHARQSVASSRRLYRTDGTLHWLQDDLTDDSLTAALPDLGTDATLAYSDGSGVTILTGQTISGDTDLPTTAETYGVIYLDRALTVEETASVTSYLNSLRGA
jgi:hypothetical protein